MDLHDNELGIGIVVCIQQLIGNTVLVFLWQFYGSFMCEKYTGDPHTPHTSGIEWSICFFRLEPMLEEEGEKQSEAVFDVHIIPTHTKSCDPNFVIENAQDLLHDLLLHHVVVDKCWHKCDGEGMRTL